MEDLLKQLESARDQLKAELVSQGGRNGNLKNALMRLEQAIAAVNRHIRHG